LSGPSKIIRINYIENKLKSSTYRTVQPTTASILAADPATGPKKGTCLPKNARKVVQSRSVLANQGLDYQCKEYEAMTLQDHWQHYNKSDRRPMMGLKRFH
jgi:hypothetical protein